MSHELSIRKDGTVEFAYAAGSDLPWHGLGQEVPAGASIDEWRKQAGMEWAIKRSKVRYATSHDYGQPLLEVPESHVLFRSDTHAPLGVVSDKYKIVQPGDVLEFFRSVVREGGLELSAAGTIYGGKRFWATAKIGEASPASLKDKIGGYLLLSTSADGSLSTEVRRTTIRVVCRNTLAMARGEAASMKINHRTTWDPTSVKEFMGLNHAAFDAFVHRLEALANKDLKLEAAEELVVSAMGGEQDKVRKSVGFNKVMDLFTNTGLGAKEDGVYGTAYGILQASTEYADHWVRARSDENRMVSSQWGPGAQFKAKMLELVEAL